MFFSPHLCTSFSLCVPLFPLFLSVFLSRSTVNSRFPLFLLLHGLQQPTESMQLIVGTESPIRQAQEGVEDLPRSRIETKHVGTAAAVAVPSGRVGLGLQETPARRGELGLVGKDRRAREVDLAAQLHLEGPGDADDPVHRRDARDHARFVRPRADRHVGGRVGGGRAAVVRCGAPSVPLELNCVP